MVVSMFILIAPIDKWLSHHPFTVESRVRIPLGVHNYKEKILKQFFFKKIIIFVLILCRDSSIGRASASYALGRRFEPYSRYQLMCFYGSLIYVVEVREL